MTEDEMVGWHHRLNGHTSLFLILTTLPTPCHRLGLRPGRVLWEVVC